MPTAADPGSGMIVLDTHVWIWWVSDPSKLSREAAGAIDYANRLGLCPISVWELAMKATAGKIQLDRPLRAWVHQASSRPRVALTPLSPAVAITAAELGERGLHGDPADRLIAATALEHGALLVTKDRKLRDFGELRTVW